MADGKCVAEDEVAIEVVAAKVVLKSADDGAGKLPADRPSGKTGAIGFGGDRVPGAASNAGVFGSNGGRTSTGRSAELVASRSSEHSAPAVEAI